VSARGESGLVPVVLDEGACGARSPWPACGGAWPRLMPVTRGARTVVQVVRLSLRCQRAVAATCTGRCLSHCPAGAGNQAALRSKLPAALARDLAQASRTASAACCCAQPQTCDGAGNKGWGWAALASSRRPGRGPPELPAHSHAAHTLPARCRRRARRPARALRDSARRMLEPAAGRAR